MNGAEQVVVCMNDNNELVSVVVVADDKQGCSLFVVWFGVDELKQVMNHAESEHHGDEVC